MKIFLASALVAVFVVCSACSSKSKSSDDDSTAGAGSSSSGQSSESETFTNFDQINTISKDGVRVEVPAESFTSAVDEVVFTLSSIGDHAEFNTLASVGLTITNGNGQPLSPGTLTKAITINLGFDTGGYSSGQVKVVNEYSTNRQTLSSGDVEFSSTGVVFELHQEIAILPNGVKTYATDATITCTENCGSGQANTYDWDFANPGSYTFNASDIDVTGGLATLQGEDLRDDDNDASGFLTVNMEGLEWNIPSSTIRTTGDRMAFPNSGVSSDIFDMSNNTLLLHLDESSGAIVDTSPNGFSGTLSGASYGATGYIGGAISLDGNDTIDFADNDAFDMGTTGFFSLTLWFKTTDSGSPNFVEKRQSGSPFKGWLMGLNGGKPSWQINDNNINSSGALGSTDYDDDNWHHLVWVVDRNAEVAHLYMDGELHTSNFDISSASGDANSTNILKVGGHISGFGGLDGELDEVAIFKREITADEVAKMYGAMNGRLGAIRSRIVGNETSRTWTGIEWQATRPLLKSIPCNRTTESTYDASNFTMATDLLLLAHFDDASWGGAGDVTDCAQVASPNNGTAVNAVQVTDGKFGKAASFDGSNDYVEFDNESNFDFAVTDDFTISAWVKTTDTLASVVGKFDYTSTPRRGYNLVIDGGRLSFDLFSSVSAPDNYFKKNDDRIISDGKWHHVAVTYDGNANDAGVKLYVDGTVSGGTTLVHDTLTTAHEVRIDRSLRVGMSQWTGQSLDGEVDEVAIWATELSAADILSLYERGSDRIQFQVRTCADNTCSGDPSFIGPDGTVNTFYDETSNSSLGYPSLSFTNLSDGKYFQYLAHFENDLLTASIPELSQVNITPSSFNGASPSITTTAGPSYSALSGFTQTLGGGNAGAARFQISNDGSSWFFHNGSSWVAASNASESNLVNEVNSAISTFVSDVGTGTLYVRAFLVSNGSQQVELEGFQVEYNP